MNFNSKYLKEYNKAEFKKKIWMKITIPLFVLAMLLCMTGLVFSGVEHIDWLMNTSGVMMFLLPFIPLLIFVYVLFDVGKKYAELKKQLFESKMLAEDILALGKENGMNLFETALAARCIHELGMEGVPEEYFRNSVMPEKKDIDVMQS